MSDLTQPTGSLINNLQANSKQPVPKVGDGATMLMWTDRRPFTIIEVSKSGKTIKLQEDNAVRTDKNGMSDCQSYEYTRNPDGAIYTATLRKNGKWVRKGDTVKGTNFGIGYRDKHYDYSF